MRIHEGARIGKYRLEKLLGRGAFGEVYLATHIHLKRKNALKFLIRLDQSNVESFRKEAEIIASLEHPNIVRVHDFDIIDDIPLIAMAYAPDGTLRERYNRRTLVPLTDVVQYIKQAATGLQYAHDRHVLHRDIKPQNLLLGADNTLWLSDFGIAVVWSTTHTIGTQDVSGTIPYMAPEHHLAHPCRASDQYALAITAYEWLTGHFPLEGTPLGLIQSHHPELQAPPLRKTVPDLPVAVEDVMLKALQGNWHARFSSIQEFAEALERAAWSGQREQSTTTTVASDHPGKNSQDDSSTWQKRNQSTGPQPLISSTVPAIPKTILPQPTQHIIAQSSLPPQTAATHFNPYITQEQPPYIMSPQIQEYTFFTSASNKKLLDIEIIAKGSPKPLYLPLGCEHGKGTGLKTMAGYTFLATLLGVLSLYYSDVVTELNHNQSTPLQFALLLMFVLIIPLVAPFPGALFGKWRGVLSTLLGVEIIAVSEWLLLPPFQTVPLLLVLLFIAPACLSSWVTGWLYEKREIASFGKSFLSLLAGITLVVTMMMISVAYPTSALKNLSGIIALVFTGVFILFPMTLWITIVEAIIHHTLAKRHKLTR